MSVRVTAITGTAVDGSGTPNPTGTVTLHLLVPGGGLAIDTAGELINADPPNPIPDPTTAVWTANVIPPGDITPAGCEWQVTQGAVQPIVSPPFTYVAGPINVTTWISSPSRLGLLKMYLTAVEGNALADAGATFGVTINADAIWTGTGGSGQLVQAGAPPITAVVDSSGDVFYYLIPQASLNPSSGYYQTPTRKQALYFTVPAVYTGDQGTYAAGTTYAANAVVRDPANNYEPYISLAGGNIGHTPNSSPSFWAVYAGERITAYLTLPSVPGTIALTQSGLSADTSVLTGSFTLPAATLQDELRQRFQADLRNAGAWDNTTAYLINDAVQLSGSWYVCILAHTGHTPPNATYWLALGGGGGGSGTVTSVSGTAPVSVATGTTTPVVSVATFIASGGSHAAGLVPDPGATAGTTKFLREDATFAVPAGGGSSAFSYVAKTANYTITTADSGIAADATGGAISAMQLPTAVGATQQYAIKKVDASTNTVTITTTSSQTIEGNTTLVLNVNGQGVVVASNGINWYIVDFFTPTPLTTTGDMLMLYGGVLIRAVLSSGLSYTVTGGVATITTVPIGTQGEICMQTGASSPPVPLWSSDGTDYVYSSS